MKKHRYAPSGRFFRVFPSDYVIYSKHKERSLDQEQKEVLKKVNRKLIETVPGLGEIGANELLLKFFSYVNGE